MDHVARITLHDDPLWRALVARPACERFLLARVWICKRYVS
jgi:hypothetical protein